MDRKAELEARIAADTAELERLKGEPDYERYLPWLRAFSCDGEFVPGAVQYMDQYQRATIRNMLTARNHDPDVVALVQWARWHHRLMSLDDQKQVETILAPFAAIK